MRPLHERDTVLSIDLDYWNTVTHHTTNFLKRVLQLDVPIILTKHHHQSLAFINRHEGKYLVNVDYHSDLCEDDADGGLPSLNCGTWGNHVRWRKKGTFVWMCPNKKKCYQFGFGRCDSARDRRTDPFKKKKSGWQKTKVFQKLKNLKLERVKAVAICVSPDYLEWNYEDEFYRVARDNSFVRLKNVLTPLPFRWLTDKDSERSKTFVLN